MLLVAAFRALFAITEVSTVVLSLRAFDVVPQGPFLYFTYWVRVLSMCASVMRAVRHQRTGDVTSTRVEAAILVLNAPLTVAYGRVDESLCLHCTTGVEDVIVHVVLPIATAFDYIYIQASQPRGALTSAAIVGVLCGSYLLFANLGLEDSPYADTPFEALTNPESGIPLTLLAMLAAALATLPQRPMQVHPWSSLLRC